MTIERDGDDGGDAKRSVVSPLKWFRHQVGMPTRALATAVATVNLLLVAITMAGFFLADVGYDWLIFREAGRRVLEGGLYRWDEHYAWSYSPLLAYFFVAIAPLGYAGWSLLHVAALGLLRDRWLIAITLVSWPFWADVYNGNTMAFVFVAAVGALHRRPIASGCYLLLCLLMPRPLMLPLMGWILWRQPEWRIRFIAMVLASAALVLFTGYGLAWFQTLLGVTEAVAETTRDIGPSNLLGGWWVVLGVILAVVLTVRGRVGWASLAASPYWLPQYFLMLLLELIPESVRQMRDARVPRRDDEVSEVV